MIENHRAFLISLKMFLSTACPIYSISKFGLSIVHHVQVELEQRTQWIRNYQTNFCIKDLKVQESLVIQQYQHSPPIISFPSQKSVQWSFGSCLGFRMI